MATTTFSGPLRVGRDPVVGVVPAQLILSLPVTAVANTDFTITLPSAVTITDLAVLTNTAYTGTTVTAQVGTTVGGAELAAATNIKPVGKNTLALLAPAMPTAGFTEGTVLTVRVVQTGPTAVGLGRLVLTYLPAAPTSRA